MVTPRGKEFVEIGDQDFDDGGGEGMLKLKDLIPRLLARWHWIVLGMALGLAVGFYQAWKAIPLYQAQATMLVRDYSVDALGKNTAAEFDIRNVQAIETIRAGILTNDLSASVASDYEVRDLKSLVPPRPKALTSLLGGKEDADESEVPPVSALTKMVRSWLSASTRKGTRLIDIKITHTDPDVARELANKVVDHYMKRRTESRSGDQQDTLLFLIAETDRVKMELQDAQKTLVSYATPLDSERALTALEAEVSVLSQRYGPKHPKMAAARGNFAGATERLKKGFLRVISNPVDADYWDAHRETLGDLVDPEAVNQARDLLISRHSVLESEVGSQKELYSTLLTQIETRELTTDNSEAEVSLQESALDGDQISPNKPKLIMTGTMVGLMAGLGLAFLFQAMDNKFHTVNDLEGQLNLPVLAAVGLFDDEVQSPSKSGVDRFDGPAAGQEKWSPQLVFREGKNSSHFEEMFRVLRTSISLLGPFRERKVTMIASALPSEGKTHVAANLAVAFAQQGLRTLLVDLDLRKPSQHKMFGLSREEQPGMVDFLSGKATLAEVLQPCPGQKNLSLILSGAKAPNPGELLESRRLDQVLDEFREEFDHIVLDTAPLLAVPDSRLIAPVIDNLTMVVRAEKTGHGPVKAAVEMLACSGLAPVGFVLNGYVERQALLGKAMGTHSYGKSGYGRYGYGASYGSVYGEEEEK